MCKILVIDDDCDLLRFITVCLEDDHEVVSTVSGKEGMELVKNTPFDVVLTDIFMPMKDGLEVVQELVKNSPQTRIIAMSATTKGGKASFLDFAMRFGATAKLAKPFTIESLHQVVDEVLALRS